MNIHGIRKGDIIISRKSESMVYGYIIYNPEKEKNIEYKYSNFKDIVNELYPVM